MSFSKNQAIQLLAQNVPASQVAATLGVDASYISQLMADDEFAAEVNETKSRLEKESADAIRFDETLEKTEEVLLENISKRAPLANLAQSLAAFRVLNNARRRKERATHTGENNVAVAVNITMPVQVIPNYTLNTANEIVEVDGKTMVSATAATVDKMLQVKTGIDRSKNERAQEVITNISAVRHHVLTGSRARTIVLDDL